MLCSDRFGESAALPNNDDENCNYSAGVSVFCGKSPCIRLGDAVMLRTAVSNLVDNACKYSPAEMLVRLNLAGVLENDANVSLRVEYQGEIRRGYQSHSGQIKACWGF